MRLVFGPLATVMQEVIANYRAKRDEILAKMKDSLSPETNAKIQSLIVGHEVGSALPAKGNFMM